MDRIRKINSPLTLLILIILLGSGLRLIRLNKAPASLDWDEVSFGYNSYSLLKTGSDEFGYKLPIYLRSFDDYKPALYSYLSIPLVYTLGLNEYSVRLLSSLSGITTILLIYLITTELFNKKTISLLAALFIAIEPWSVHFSRAVFEANLALTLYLFAFLLYLKSRKNINYFLPASIFLCLSIHAYLPEEILFIPTLFFFFIVNRKALTKKTKILSLTVIISTILIFPSVSFHLKNRQSFGRLGSTSVIKLWQNGPQTRRDYLLENKIFSFSKEILSRYASYFSPVNIFVRGSPEPTQKIASHGVLYSFEFFLWIVGLYILTKNVKKYWPLTFLILISPIPAAITWNWFYPARVLPLFSAYSILSALGLYHIYSYSKSKFPKVHFLVWSAFSVYLIASLVNLATTIFFYMSYTDRGTWQHGMKEIIKEIAPIQNEYEQIIFETRTAQPHIFVLFHSEYPPELYQQEVAELAKNFEPRKNFNFGKYVFRDVYLPSKDENARNTLLVGPPSSLPIERVKANPHTNRIIIVQGEEGSTIAHIVGLK